MPREGKYQFLRGLHINNFSNKISNIIVLLYRSRGNEKAHKFEEWMYLFIQVVLTRNQLLDWKQLISDWMYDMMVFFVVNKSFFMSFYLIYAIASTRP